MQTNRREMMAAALGLAAAAQARGADDPVAVPGKRPMILHNDRPEDLETPVKDLQSYLTPVDAFFVRQHIPRPGPIDTEAYRLTLNGMVVQAAPGFAGRPAQAAAIHGYSHPGMHRQRARILHAQGSRHSMGTRSGGQRRVERAAYERCTETGGRRPQGGLYRTRRRGQGCAVHARFHPLHAHEEGDASGYAAGARA